MKKRYALLLILLFFAVFFVSAQSLENNEYYKKSVEFAGLSQSALDNGQYVEADDYARKSQEYAELSRQYIERMRLAYRARSAYVAAKARIDKARQMNLSRRDGDLWQEASRVFAAATMEFNAEDYAKSIPDSQQVVALLRDFEALFSRSATDTAPGAALAAFYEVKLNRSRRDCLWRIAGFSFVYGDPYQWRRLYEANRDTFPDPNNPNWIEPGMILKIPSIKGEVREGSR
jgi:nucleoid-associated protein YgaU